MQLKNKSCAKSKGKVDFPKKGNHPHMSDAPLCVLREVFDSSKMKKYASTIHNF